MHKKTNLFGRRMMACAIVSVLLLCMPGIGALANDISPTTGLPTDKPYRPVMAQISNSIEARPPWGLEDADVVYEAIIWGPVHTRYLAVYNDVHPQQIGAIRGARVYGTELREAWDCPFVHMGGQQIAGSSIYDFYQENKVDKAFSWDGTRGTGGFKDDASRVNPHNGVFALAEWVQNEWPKDENGNPYEPALPGLQFSRETDQGRGAVGEIEVFYGDDDYRVGYTYDDGTGLYTRSYDGEPQYGFDGARAIQCSNVIVQCNELWYYENSMMRPMMSTTGTGEMTAFIGGKQCEGTWKREDLHDPIRYYTADGEELLLMPGKTYIQIIPPWMYENATDAVTDGKATYINGNLSE